MGVEGGIGISDAYEQYYQQEQERLQLQIISMDEQLEAMVDAYKDLPPISREKARKKMETLEEEIGRLKAQVDPLTERMDSVYDQLTRMDAGIATAQVTVREQSNRQKAEAVSRVIDKIICHFVENPDRKPNEPSSIPTMIEVVPVSGSGNQPISYPCEISPTSRSRTGRPTRRAGGR